MCPAIPTIRWLGVVLVVAGCGRLGGPRAECEVDTGHLKDALAVTYSAAEKDVQANTPPLVQGILCRCGLDALELYGTDGRRLAKATLPAAPRRMSSRIYFLPVSQSVRLSDLREKLPSSGSVMVEYSDDVAVFRTRDFSSEIPLVHPAQDMQRWIEDIEQVLQSWLDDERVPFRVDRRLLLSRLETLSQKHGSDSAGRTAVEVTIQLHELILYLPSTDVPPQHLPIEYAGLEVRSAFNVHDLIEMLQALPAQERSIQMTFGTPPEPLVVHEGRYVYLLLPMNREP